MPLKTLLSVCLLAACILCTGSAFGDSEALPAEISLEITDSALAPLSIVDGNEDDPALLGADFLLNLKTSDAQTLATYAQRIQYNSNLIRYATGVFEVGLTAGIGKNPGSLVVDATHWNDGPSSYLVVASSGISGYTGPQTLVRIGFEVIAPSGGGTVTVQDDSESMSPYSDASTAVIPHNSPGTPVSFTILSGSNVEDKTWNFYR